MIENFNLIPHHSKFSERKRKEKKPFFSTHKNGEH